MRFRYRGGITMARDEWNEEQIEKLLTEMPDIKDNRSATEILRKLHNDERLSEQRRTRKNGRWIPAIVSVAALLLLTILIPSILQKTTLHTANDEVSIKESMDSKDLSVEQIEKADHSVRQIDSNYVRFALYDEELGNQTAFPIGLVSDMATSIPVTMLIPQTTIEQDFAQTSLSTFDLYMHYAVQIDEEALGFQEYHPYVGELQVDGNVIVHHLPTDHPYDLASASIAVYTNSLQNTFIDFEEVHFQQMDGSPIEFDQVGEEAAPLQLTNNRQRVNYYVFTSQMGQSFLSTNDGTQYDRLESALIAMKEQPNELFQSVFPSNIDFTVTKEKAGTLVKFNEPVDLESMDLVKAQQMIDAILLTAASFNESIRFENIVQTNWNGLDFSGFMPQPIGPNPLPAIFK